MMVSGFSSFVSRVHAGLWPGVVDRFQTDEERIYLTFDDGPSDSIPELLRMLERTNARVTFFFSAGNVDANMAKVSDVLAAGHVIGVHGTDHLSAWSARSEVILEDHARAVKILEVATGERICWARPPFGLLTPALWNWYRMSGLRVALWDVNPKDYKPETTAAAACRLIRASVRPGSIVLLHEGKETWNQGFDALAELVSEMSAEGWHFESLPTTA